MTGPADWVERPLRVAASAVDHTYPNEVSWAVKLMVGVESGWAGSRVISIGEGQVRLH